MPRRFDSPYRRHARQRSKSSGSDYRSKRAPDERQTENKRKRQAFQEDRVTRFERERRRQDLNERHESNRWESQKRQTSLSPLRERYSKRDGRRQSPICDDRHRMETEEGQIFPSDSPHQDRHRRVNLTHRECEGSRQRGNSSEGQRRAEGNHHSSQSRDRDRRAQSPGDGQLPDGLSVPEVKRRRRIVRSISLSSSDHEVPQSRNNSRFIEGRPKRRRSRSVEEQDRECFRSSDRDGVPKEGERQRWRSPEVNKHTSKKGTVHGTGHEEPPDQDEDLAAYAAKKITKVTVESIGRAGGVYIPPHKLRELQGEAKPGTVEYQRRVWEALRKSLNGLVNRVNYENVADVVVDVFRENLIQGRGLFARAVVRAQMSSPSFTPIYAALVAVVNTKLPAAGELVLHRVMQQFRRAYRRHDKIVAVACVKFLAHLVNQRVADELVALQLAALLLEKLTDDSVEVCVHLIQQVGQVLSANCPRGLQAIMERFRSILHEGTVDKRAQFVIEKLFDNFRKGFDEYPGVAPELDLVEEEDAVTHSLDILDGELNLCEELDVFQPLEWEDFEENERKWARQSREILGEESEGESSEDSEAEGKEVAEEDDDEEAQPVYETPQQMRIKDMTETEIVQLRKAIYLTVVSSASFEECVHKLMKMNIREGCEIEVATMLVDCCAQERTFQRFFSLQAARLCALRRVYQECFINCLQTQYHTVHRLETNKLRNVAKFFAHLFYTDALPWECMELFVLSEEATTSASRIFVKVLLQELSEQMGFRKLFDRLQEPPLAPYVASLFPTDSVRAMRFSINFFTAIGLGALADPLREQLADAMETAV